MTSYTYDKRGQQLSATMVVTTLSGNQTITTSSTYDNAGKTLTTTDPLGRVTRPIYDQYSRPYKTIFADGSFTEMGYDSRGRKIWDRQQRLEGEPIIQTDYEYDDLGRLIAVVQPQVSVPGGGHARPRYEYSYDRFGNHVKTKDALNRETLFAYDFAGRQTSRTLPAAGGQNNIETWEYSTTADVAAQLFPIVGLLKKHTDFNGNENRPHYDNRGRVDVNRWYKPGNVLDLEVSYQFDNRGRLQSYTDYRGTTTYTFDIESRTTQIASPEGTLNYEFNHATGWHTRTWTTHNDFQYAYDQAGRLEKITVSKLGDSVYTTGNELTTTYGYNAAGLLTTILRKNGSTTIAKTENTYDLLHRIETITQKNAADVAFASYSYTRMTDGKISAVDEVTSGVNRRVEYLYDDLGRLTQEKRSLLDYDIYQFDVVGNRTKKTHHTGGSPIITDYTYDARDRLLSETTGSNAINFGYDPNGSQITQDAPGSDIETYTWDARNRLSGASITRDNVTTNTGYKYDDGGIRSEVTENGVTTKHLTDSMNPTGYAQVIEQTSGGVLLVSTVYGVEPIAQKDSSGVSLYLAEAHSGTRLLIDVNAVILQQIVYDAYGILLSGSAGNAAIPVLYRGERFDGTLQNYYLRARYFNPSTGAFNQVDQFTGVRILPSTLNKYVYTSSDPMNHLDPSGNIQIGLIISLSIVGFLTAASLWYMSLSEGAFHDIDRSSGGATKYDVASELVAIRNFTLQQANATPRVKEKAKEEIESVIGIFRNLMMGNTAGAGNWDISGLNFTHSPLNDKTQAVSVGNAVFEKGEVNYWILGVWAKIADIELARLEQSITEYRLFKNSPDAGPSSVPGRIGWLRAGYHGDFKYASRFSYPNAQVSNAKYAGPFEFHIGSFRGILHNGTIKQK